jgi:hypothetical protein
VGTGSPQSLTNFEGAVSVVPARDRGQQIMVYLALYEDFLKS